MNYKKEAKKMWNFLWHEDSVMSWVVNIIIAFILVRFLIYPGLGVLFGTSLPVVAVVSGSMEHDGNFDSWWDIHEDFYLSKLITKQQFELYPLKNGFNKGDVIILTGTDINNIKRGEVIVYEASKQYPIIHRVVDIHNGTYESKGDHNMGQDPRFELNINPEQILGKANFRIPFLGWIKIGFSCGVDSIFGNPNIPHPYNNPVETVVYKRFSQCMVANT